jgi:hypothetical protein
MKSEIVRRRVREMFAAGFTVQDISAVVDKTDKHVRNIIAQEFPNGRPSGESAHFSAFIQAPPK